MVEKTWKESLDELKKSKGCSLERGSMDPESMSFLLESAGTIINNVSRVIRVLIETDNKKFLEVLCLLKKVIMNNISSDIYKHDSECTRYEETIVYGVIESKELSYLDKAKILLGYDE